MKSLALPTKARVLEYDHISTLNTIVEHGNISDQQVIEYISIWGQCCIPNSEILNCGFRVPRIFSEQHFSGRDNFIFPTPSMLLGRAQT